MSKYDVRVGDKVILREEEWEEIYPENAIVGKVYTVIPEHVEDGDFITNGFKVQIDFFDKVCTCYQDFVLYQTNTKVTDVEIGDIIEVVLLDSRQLNAYPEMTKFLGKRGVVKEKGNYLFVKFDDEVDEAIWAIHYHCVRVVEKIKPKSFVCDGEFVTSNNSTIPLDVLNIKDTIKPTDIDPPKPKPIQSNGGSSSYYDLPIPEELLNKILERKVEGEAYIKTEEIIRYCFGNDFDKGNLFKSLVRIHSAELGFGKAGNSIEYDCNKIHYSADKIAQRNK